MKQATLYHLSPETVTVARNIIEYSTIVNDEIQAILRDTDGIVLSTVEKHNLRVHNFVETKYDRNKRKVVEKESFIAMTPEVEEVLRTVLVAKYMEKIEELEKKLFVAEDRAANYFAGHSAYVKFCKLPLWKRLFYKGE